MIKIDSMAVTAHAELESHTRELFMLFFLMILLQNEYLHFHYRNVLIFETIKILRRKKCV